MVLASGTQAEPMSALSRIAVDNHRLLSIAENDTVILSARIIPGNEKAIFRMIDHFFRRRVLVYYEGGRSAPIHVSGHASQEEMKILLQLVRPKYFIPLHGEYRQLFRHAALAEQVGAVSGEIFLLESGQPVEFTADGGAVPARACDRGARLRRFRLARGNRRSRDPRPPASFRRRRGRARSSPSTSTPGASKSRRKSSHADSCPAKTATKSSTKAREVILRTVEQSSPEEKTDWSVIKEKIRVDLKRYLNKQTSKRPLILPVILEV